MHHIIRLRRSDSQLARKVSSGFDIALVVRWASFASASRFSVSQAASASNIPRLASWARPANLNNSADYPSIEPYFVDESNNMVG